MTSTTTDDNSRTEHIPGVGEIVHGEPVTDTPDTAEAPDTTEAKAARLRRRAQAAEAERDTLRDRLDALQRRMVEDVLTGTLERPASLWLTGLTVADFVDETGELKPDAVIRDTARQTAEEYGLGLARRRYVDPTAGLSSWYGGASGALEWGDVLKRH